MRLKTPASADNRGAMVSDVSSETLGVEDKATAIASGLYDNLARVLKNGGTDRFYAMFALSQDVTRRAADHFSTLLKADGGLIALTIDELSDRQETKKEMLGRTYTFTEETVGYAGDIALRMRTMSDGARPTEAEFFTAPVPTDTLAV